MKGRSLTDTTPEDPGLFNLLLRYAEASESAESIPAEVVKRGIASSDIVTNGLVFEILHSPALYQRIAPPLTLDDFQILHIKYLPRCMKERRDSEWRLSPYLAAHALARWFLHLWRDGQEHLKFLTDWKDALGQLFIEGGSEVRDCVVCGVLEHLFGNQTIRDFFSDWKNHPVLHDAYSDAVGMVS
jgi:hypothetical protein